MRLPVPLTEVGKDSTATAAQPRECWTRRDFGTGEDRSTERGETREVLWALRARSLGKRSQEKLHCPQIKVKSEGGLWSG